MQRRAGQPGHRRQPGVERQQLGGAERDALESADLVIEAVRLLLATGLLLDEGEVALEGGEVALDGGLADVELLGQLLDAPRSRRGRQQPQRELIDELADAIARRRRCELTYHAAWNGTTRTHAARPLRLVWHNAALYLLACLGDHERITTLAVHRIRELTIGAATFAPPAVDVDDHVHRAFGIFVSDGEEDVEIVFDADIAWRVEERTYHPDERKERLADGRLRYRVRSSAQWEIVPWVLGYGPLAELVAPATWRASIRASLAASAAPGPISSGPAAGRHRSIVTGSPDEGSGMAITLISAQAQPASESAESPATPTWNQSGGPSEPTAGPSSIRSGPPA